MRGIRNERFASDGFVQGVGVDCALSYHDDDLGVKIASERQERVEHTGKQHLIIR